VSVIETAPPTIHRGEGDLPFVDLGDAGELQLLQVDLAQGVWVVRNRFQPDSTVQTHRHTGDECLLGGLARFAADRHVPGFKVHHYMMMDYPESEVWSPEQQLMLRYSSAVLENTMTDALWKEAVDAWGVKMCLRYIQWIGYFWYAGVRNRTLRVPYPMATEAEGHVKPL